MVSTSQNNLDTWFTPEEIKDILNQIITKVQLSDLGLGVMDDQLLLLHILDKNVVSGRCDN